MEEIKETKYIGIDIIHTDDIWILSAGMHGEDVLDHYPTAEEIRQFAADIRNAVNIH